MKRNIYRDNMEMEEVKREIMRLANSKRGVRKTPSRARD